MDTECENLYLKLNKKNVEILKSVENIVELPVDLTEEKMTTNIDKFKFRSTLAQILAVSSINLILLNLGIVLAFPTIIISRLVKSTDDLKFSEEQASWFGSLAFIFQPIGSSFSGLLFEPIGRKNTMLYINIPLVVGWLLIRFGTEVFHLFTAEIIMGISIGFMDAPHITYLGEITQPKLRAILTSYAELSVSLGFCFVYFLGLVIDWKTMSSVCCFIPILSMFFISWIPESPIWLLSKKKVDRAIKSLCWLRGWVKPEIVCKEFLELNHQLNIKTNKINEFNLNENHISESNSKKKCVFSKIIRTAGLSELFRKSVLLPAFLVAFYFGFSHIVGVTNTRPFMISILNEFGTPVNPIWVTAISSIVGIIGFISGMILIPKIGKRRVSILSMLGCALVNGLLSIHGFFFSDYNVLWVPVVLFILLNFIWSLGIGQIPWMLISEVFPFKGRGIASGVVAAISYIQAFVFIKTYYSLQYSFSLAGVFGFFGLCAALGSVFLYVCLPETEGKTLSCIESDLENHFNNLFQKCFLNLAKTKNFCSNCT